MYAVTRNTAQDLPDALFDHSIEFALALDEQATGEAHCVDAQLVACLRESVRLLLTRNDVYVIKRENDVVRDWCLCGGAVGYRRRISAEGRKREVEQLHKRFLQSRSELIRRASGEVTGEAADVVGVREVIEGERTF